MVEVSQHAIKHWLALWEKLHHCLEQWNAHNVEKAKLHSNSDTVMVSASFC